ncbi:MAG: hypothetical protein LH609_07075 [Rudanella sp.]|nr:hypothetical protein [Rudanella sp.]
MDSRNLGVKVTTSLRQGIFSTARYDEDGFRVRYESSTGGAVDNYIIKDKNIVLYDSYLNGGFGTLSIRFEYYPSRPNLPELTPFKGRTSQNLPSKRIQASIGSVLHPIGDVFQENFYYEFDARGRVKRRITYSYLLNPGWRYQTDNGGIGITDYEYECP